MKKLVILLTTIIMMLAITATTVNAANLTVDKKEVNIEEEILVTLKLDESSRSLDLELKYEGAKFEYVPNSATSNLGPGALTINAANPGVIYVSGSNAAESTDYITFTFKALSGSNGAEFIADGLVTESNEGISTRSVKVKVLGEGAESSISPIVIIAAVVVVTVGAIVVVTRKKSK